MLTLRPLPDRLPSLVALDPEEEALLRGCLACPWDDVSFLVYADWLEEQQQNERADFVRRQLARVGEWWIWDEAPEAVQAWAARVVPGEWQYRLRFARGLPGILYVEDGEIRDLSSAVLAGWIWGIRSHGGGASLVQALVSSLHLARLTSLDLRSNRISAVGAQVLVASSHLAQLTYTLRGDE